MTLIPEGKPVHFWPNGEGTYPRVEIQRMVRYQPGDSKHSHWNVRIFESEKDSDPPTLELQTWGDIDRSMTERYGPAFRKQFPTAEDRGRELLEEFGRNRQADDSKKS